MAASTAPSAASAVVAWAGVGLAGDAVMVGVKAGRVGTRPPMLDEVVLGSGLTAEVGAVGIAAKRPTAGRRSLRSRRAYDPQAGEENCTQDDLLHSSPISVGRVAIGGQSIRTWFLPRRLPPYSQVGTAQLAKLRGRSAFILEKFSDIAVAWIIRVDPAKVLATLGLPTALDVDLAPSVAGGLE